MNCKEWLTASLMIGVSCCGAAQDAIPAFAQKSEAKAVSPLRKRLDESLHWNELVKNENSTQPMSARVVMRWANNARGSEDGMTAFYLWEGRPEAVCCIFPWGGSLQHNFDSLSRETLIAKRDGKVVWQPEKPGTLFMPIPEAGKPADSPVERLRHMKALASRFSSTMLGWRADSSDREFLRRLPQPLYRYESKRKDILDGCVMAFVQGTDPESLLLLEAFRNGAEFEWQFAFVRRTSGELEGRLDDKLVWHVDRYPDNHNPRSTYFTLTAPLESEPASAIRTLP